MGLLICRGGDGSRRALPYLGVYQEATYDHIREDGLSPRICTVNGGGADAEDVPVGAMVRSRRDKLTRGVDEE